MQGVCETAIPKAATEAKIRTFNNKSSPKSFEMVKYIGTCSCQIWSLWFASKCLAQLTSCIWPVLWIYNEFHFNTKVYVTYMCKWSGKLQVYCRKLHILRTFNGWMELPVLTFILTEKHTIKMQMNIALVELLQYTFTVLCMFSFYGRYGDLIKHYEVSLSQMLHDILGHDHIQWHTQLIRHYTNLRTYYRTGL